ncbi:MAG: NAD(P)H-binding protein [Chloroflexota bacterium]
MKIVVTGAAGLTGSAVTRLLLDRGHEVIAGVHTRERASGVDPRAHIAVLDLGDVDAVTPVIRSCDALVHVAGIHLAEAVARACGGGDPARLVVVSTANAMLPQHPNAAMYLAREDRLRAARPDLIVVRPTMIYGSLRDRNVHKVVLLAHRWRLLPVPSSGGARIQPVHYLDLAQVLVRVLDRDVGPTLAAGGPSALTLEQCARLIFGALGMRPRLVRIPVSPALDVARVWDRVTGSRLAPRVARSEIDRVVDVGEMMRVTGISPRTFEDGLGSLISEMRASGAL